MNDFFRFSDYDIFAYLASGLATMSVLDLAFSTGLVLGTTWTASTAALSLAGAYIVGHVVASLASWSLQSMLTHKILRPPIETLMTQTQRGWRRWLGRSALRAYYSPMESDLRARALEKARRHCSSNPSGEQLFWCAFPVAKGQPITYGRMERFLRLYGFCRNIAFVGISGSLTVLLTGGRVGVAALLLLGGLSMLHRYLKFYRAYALEVLVALADPE